MDGPRTSPEPPSDRPERPPLARTLLVVFGLSGLLSTLFVLAVGERGMRKHTLRASISTRADPVALFGAIVEPDALRESRGQIPGYGKLVRVSWSAPPAEGVRVTEHFDEAEKSQSYVVSAWDPPWAIEERYEFENENIAIVEQRWNIYTSTSGPRLEVLQRIYPQNRLGGFALELSGDRPAREKELTKLLERIDAWAVAHPRTSTTQVIERLPIEE